ncbi:MAG: rhodanese-like domain-containing protein [Pseudomonadota bacterium]
MILAGVLRSAVGGLVLFLSLTTFSAAVSAAEGSVRPEIPESLAVAITIDSEHLIELYHSVPGLKLIDSRQKGDFSQGHIETSASLPLQNTSCNSLKKVARDKDQALVFYCNGNVADASIGAIQVASSCGYKRLFWFRGGFVEWTDKDYPYLTE